MGFPRREYWSGLPVASPRDLPNPGIEPISLYLLHWQAGSSPLGPPGKRSPSALHQFSLVQSLSRVRLFATPWTAACQASLSITNSWSLLKLVMPFEWVKQINNLQIILKKNVLLRKTDEHMLLRKILAAEKNGIHLTEMTEWSPANS